MTALLLRDVPYGAYHADAVDEWRFVRDGGRVAMPVPPRLSRSMAVKLLNESPLHAWGAHPKLGGKPPVDDTTASDAGSLLHGLLLGHGADVAVCRIPARDSRGKLREASPAYGLEDALRASLDPVADLIPAKDWLTKDAQRFREEARAEGKLPVLLHDLVAAEKIVPVLKEQLDYETEGAFSDVFDTEVTALWEADGVACKARLDLLSLGRGIIWDLKFLADAHPGAFGRSMRANGYDVQHAASREAIETIHPELAGRVDFQFVGIEVDPRSRIPVQIGGKFIISMPPIGATKRDLGEQRWQRAKKSWRRSLELNALIASASTPKERERRFREAWPCYDTSAPIEAAPYELQDEMNYQLARAEEAEWLKGA